MGNTIRNMLNDRESNEEKPIEKFVFHGIFPEGTNNGLYFNNIYIPEEVLLNILSYIDGKNILKASLVCRKWCNMIKSTQLWTIIYHRKYPNKKAARLPWYCYYCLFSTNYFNTNLLRNGNGEEGFKYWKIVTNGGDEFKVEDPPIGSDLLPIDIPDFNGHTSCFATSFHECNKLQIISFKQSKLMKFILTKYKPHIYLSEWVAGRFDCGCQYTLWCRLCGNYGTTLPTTTPDSIWNQQWDVSLEHVIYSEFVKDRIEQWAGSSWHKVELTVEDYPNGVDCIVFQHAGNDTQFWKGHYGSKMAGGVVKVLFETIQEQTNEL